MQVFLNPQFTRLQNTRALRAPQDTRVQNTRALRARKNTRVENTRRRRRSPWHQHQAETGKIWQAKQTAAAISTFHEERGGA